MASTAPWLPGGRRGLFMATAVVLGAHVLLLARMPAPGLGAAAADGMPARLRVSFVRELAPAEPVLRQRPARALPRPRAAQPALPPARDGDETWRAQAAAAIEGAASAPELLAALPAAQDGALGPVAGAAVDAAADFRTESPIAAPAAGFADQTATAPPAAADPLAGAATPDATTFDWPPSTRLEYRVTGQVDGPVEGDAVVEWLRQGERYQVRLEISVALVARRRIASDGLITPTGLAPRRYDEETRILLREPRRVQLLFGPETLQLADGRTLPRPPGVQDSASQFVQMTWLFNVRPELLQPGQSIAFPLALPRRVEPWIYDVLAAEPQATPAGWLPTVHVKPRREATGGDLTAEFWVAPSLQHLPVRMIIRQGPRLWLDLALAQMPLQAEPGR
jgi:hypothetical protein